MSTPRTRRYPGLHYFTAEQKDLFFGREAEKRDLLALVLTEKIVALFSKSGYGKSSLLRAGLAPELPVAWLPVIVQFGAYQAGQSPAPLARVLGQLDAALPHDAPEMDFLETICPEDSLWKRFKKKQSTEKRTFLLIFDQFEEFQTYPAEQREAFKKQLAELLFTRIPQAARDRSDALPESQQELLARPNEVKALFAIREDRLGVLDGLADKLPAILHKRYHLQGLDDAQATAAITLPAALPQGERFESPTFRYAPAAVEAIKKGLKKDERDPHIESFLLQICCEAIEQKVIGFRRLGGKIVVTEAELPVFKDLFEQYYRGKIAALPDEARRNAARRMIEDQLVKTDPASGIAYRINADGRALCALPGVDESLLKQLTDFFLLRSEPNTTGGFSYEVSHDRLVEGILVMKKEWEAEEAKRQLAAEAERIEREKADAERRRKRAFWTAVVAGVLILVAVGASVIAFFENRRATDAIELSKAAQKDAEKKEEDARAAEQKANEAIRQSGIDSEIAQKAIAEAKQKRKEADEARRRANLAFANLKLETDAKTPIFLEALKKWEAANHDTLQGDEWKTKVDSLSFSGRDLTNLPDQVYECENLHALELRGTPTLALSDVLAKLGRLKKLRWLDLSYNDLNKLPAEIGELKRLEILILDNNQLTKLPAEIGELKRLERLDLRDNQLTELHENIKQVTGLKTLDLSNNPTLNLEKTLIQISELSDLTTLLLWGNHFKKLPEQIGKLEGLEVLYLNNNDLDSLPPQIGKLKKLRHLYIDFNHIAKLPDEIGNLKELRSLDLVLNELVEINPNIGKLKELVWLGLGGNKLTAVPVQIGKFDSLKTLGLAGNKLSTLPAEIGALKNLENLNLRMNEIVKIPTEIGQLASLENLSLDSNKLTILPVEIGDLKNLKYLDLSKNLFKTFPAQIIELTKLYSLNLADNKLTELPEQIGELKELNNLDLSNNQLTTLPKQVFRLEKLRELDLRKNPISESQKDEIRELLPLWILIKFEDYDSYK